MASDLGKARLTTPSERTVHTEREFDAPREDVWRAFTDRDLFARWWGRGNPLDIEKLEVTKGGHWRVVEHAPEGPQGFEGRYREVTAPERLVQTFEWDGMPGYSSVTTTTFEDLGGSRTRLVTDSQFMTTEERDGMMGTGMEEGLEASYAALGRVLESLRAEQEP